MADYWKSIEKKYCDTCKCWLTDNVSSIQFHESGKRHQENVQKRLKDIQKQTKISDKADRKMENQLKRINEAALEAINKDKESNPDMSLKIEAYMDLVKEREAKMGGGLGTEEEKKSTGPKVLHREEKKKKPDPVATISKPYTHRGGAGGWEPVVNTRTAADLELPSSSYSTSTGKGSNPTGTIEYTPKIKEKKKHVFEEKTVRSLNLASTSSSNSPFVKDEPVPEVAFKKRKFSKSNMRQRDD